MIDVLLEPAFIALITIVGVLTLLRLGSQPSLWLVPIGLIAGFCEFVIINYAQAILPVSSSPVLTLLILLVISSFLTYDLVRNGSLPSKRELINLCLGLTGILALALVFDKVNLLKFHYDSYTYLMTGRYIYTDSLDQLSSLFANKRYGTAAIIHSVAETGDRLYLRSITPLMSLAGLSSLLFIIWAGFKDKVQGSWLQRRVVLGVAALGMLMLITNHSFWFHSFYINGHMFFATLLLVVVGIGWLLLVADRPDRRALIALQSLALATLVLTRPEAAIVAALAIAPQVVSASLSSKHKTALMLSFGAAVLMERAFLLLNSWGRTGVDFSLLLDRQRLVFTAIGVGAIVLAPIVSRQFFTKYQRALLWLAELGMWGLLAVFYLRGQAATAVINKSLHSFYHNLVLGSGAWGLLILGLVLLGGLALIKKDVPGRLYLRYSLTTFLPASLLFAIFRGGGYRVGNGDSFNRSLMHILFLAILFISVTAISGLLKSTHIQIRDSD